MDRQSANRAEPRRPASTSTAAWPGKQTLTEALPGASVAKIYDPDDLGDGWVEVRVTHGGPLEATGFLQTAQLAEHHDEPDVDWNQALQLYRELAGGSFRLGRRQPVAETRR